MALPDFAADERREERQPRRSDKERIANLTARTLEAHHGRVRVVRPPLYVSDILQETRGLAIWLSVGTFWSKLHSRAVFQHFAKVFEG